MDSLQTATRLSRRKIRRDGVCADPAPRHFHQLETGKAHAGATLVGEASCEGVRPHGASLKSVLASRMISLCPQMS
jgi:hypothetical protein